jgi:hypothetical protein
MANDPKETQRCRECQCAQQFAHVGASLRLWQHTRPGQVYVALPTIPHPANPPSVPTTIPRRSNTPAPTDPTPAATLLRRTTRAAWPVAVLSVSTSSYVSPSSVAALYEAGSRERRLDAPDAGGPLFLSHYGIPEYSGL